MAVISSEESYRGHQIFFKPGNNVIATQNCFSWAGCVLLANQSEEKLNRVYDM